ncbi:cysteine desulfurase family protein [Compostibacter hankyongensis]
MPEQLIYMDYNATTPCDPRVVEAMLPYFSARFGNAASHTHAFGWEAREAAELAREQVAGLIGAEAGELVFTSGATEAINLALKGIFELYRHKGNHIITCVTEHKAVLDTCAELERRGAAVTYLPVDGAGRLDPDALAAALTPQTLLVSVMYANNETGVIQDIPLLSRLSREQGALFMTDATQALGKIPVEVNRDGIDLLCCSAHKLYGPKGAGALYLRRRAPRVRLHPLIHGGGHEKGLRSGTLNVPGIVGLGAAAECCRREMQADAARLGALRDELEKTLLRTGRARINGDAGHRLPHVSNLAFLRTDGNALLSAVTKRVAVSSGSACTSALPRPSHVLSAMGLDPSLARASLRLSLGRMTTPEEVQEAARFIGQTLAELGPTETA